MEVEATSRPSSLEERVAFLESQNEGLKRVGGLGLVLVLLLGGLFVHQTYTDLRSTTTHSITLLSDKDEVAGAITCDAQGRWLFLQARDGLLAPAETLAPEFRGFAFYDSEGRPRVLVGEGPGRETVLVAGDPVRGTSFDAFPKAPVAPKSPAPAPSPVPSSTPR